jgi:GH24 family phage-related lysozyme (muramidase)
MILILIDLKGSRRAEMARIRDLVPSKNYSAIAQEIRNMKRIWKGKGLDGLLRRRDKEASLVDSCA